MEMFMLFVQVGKNLFAFQRHYKLDTEADGQAAIEETGCSMVGDFLCTAPFRRAALRMQTLSLRHVYDQGLLGTRMAQRSRGMQENGEQCCCHLVTACNGITERFKHGRGVREARTLIHASYF